MENSSPHDNLYLDFSDPEEVLRDFALSLRNPLTSMQGWIKLLSKDPEDKEALEMLLKLVNHMASLRSEVDIYLKTLDHRE